MLHHDFVDLAKQYLYENIILQILLTYSPPITYSATLKIYNPFPPFTSHLQHISIFIHPQETTAAWPPSSSCTGASGSTWSSPTSPPSSSSSCPGSASGWTWSTCRGGWRWGWPRSSPSPASPQVSALRLHKSAMSRWDWRTSLLKIRKMNRLILQTLRL